MESEGDEAFRLQPKRSKLTNFSSNSMHNSSIKIPINMPEELITEILLRLPVKSLLQFRSVSKSWLRLISSPQFVKTHLSVCANKKDYKLTLGFDSQYNLKGCSLSSLFYDSITEAFDLDYPMKTNTDRYACVMGSVNGLICLSFERKDLFLWNPSIRKFKKLPDAGAYRYFMNYGFGYDELHDDYKVVIGWCYWGNDGLQHTDVKIYSLNGDSWINIECFQMGAVLGKPEGMFVNGRLHWLNTSPNNGWWIISVDLADGKSGNVGKPCYGKRGCDLTPCLGVLGSDLSLFHNSWRGYVDVWIMKDYGVKESWTKMFTISGPDNPFSPFSCKSIEGEVMFGFKCSFMIYNKKVGLTRHRRVINCDTFTDVNIYIESLLWPFSEEGTRDTTEGL